jgi:hypothetical protein
MTYNTEPVIARFYWGSKDPKDDYQYPGPWVSFPNMTAYKKWATAIRKYRPKNNHGKRTYFEYYYVDNTWTAEGLLHLLQTDPERQTAPQDREGR